MNLNEKIKKLRIEKGYTQKKLSELSGLSISTIQKLEYNDLKLKNEMILKLIKAFNMDISEFQNFINKNEIKELEQVEKIKNVISNNSNLSLEYFKNNIDFFISYYSVFGLNIPLNSEMFKNNDIDVNSDIYITFNNQKYKIQIFELINILNILGNSNIHTLISIIENNKM